MTVALVLLACGDDAGVTDGGPADGAARMDTGVPDGSLPDATIVDSGNDAEPTDAGGGLLVPVFFSDWRTVALGTDNALVDDGGKWDLVAGNDRGEVIDAPDGFPTAHALQVRYQNGGFVILRHNGLPVPPVGTTRNYRWYYRNDQPDWPMDNTQHPIQDGNAQGDISWSFNTNVLSDTTWENYFGVQVNNGENDFEHARWYSPMLTTSEVYRFELQVHRTGASTFEMHARVHASDDTLLHDDVDFTNAAAGGALSLADAPSFTFNEDTSRPFYGADTLNGLNAGCNGVTGVTTAGFPYAVQAGFAVVDGLAPGTFIGPYGTVEGEVP
jgi:hypothetical protein